MFKEITEIGIYKVAVAEARRLLAPPGDAAAVGYVVKADEVLQKAEEDVDQIMRLRQIVQEEIKKSFGEV